MLLNTLLTEKNIDPSTVLVFRHRPRESALNKVLPWLAAEHPDLFNAYQQTQGARTEAAMQKAEYVASFIGHEPGKAIFVALYSVADWSPMTKKQYWQHESNIELKKYGLRGWSSEDQRKSILWFDLQLCDFFEQWKGKLVVIWPGKELSYWRWSNRNDITVHSIAESSLLAPEIFDWDTLNLTWSELSVLPTAWKNALQHWRGVYFIFDSLDAKGYVGSAYGKYNILGRWQNYATRGHGGNKHLRSRDPNSFRFTILQRVSPDMEPNDVIALESNWKARLHTRFPHGLNDN